MCHLSKQISKQHSCESSTFRGRHQDEMKAGEWRQPRVHSSRAGPSPVPSHQSPEDSPEEATCWTAGRATGERRGRDLLQALTQESREGRTGLGQNEPRPSPEGTGWTVL